jgi:hypothetical protein
LVAAVYATTVHLLNRHNEAAANEEGKEGEEGEEGKEGEECFNVYHDVVQQSHLMHHEYRTLHLASHGGESRLFLFALFIDLSTDNVRFLGEDGGGGQLVAQLQGHGTVGGKRRRRSQKPSYVNDG